MWAYIVSVACLGVGVLATVLAVLVLVPARLVIQLVRSIGHLWAYPLVLGVIAWRFAHVFNRWNGVLLGTLTDFTFRLVGTLLRLFVSADLVVDRTTKTIGTHDFNVTIQWQCCGLEGTALMLVFTIGLLWFMRGELRFPRAILLVPAGMAVMWVSNALRITLLILIGVAGAPAVAMGGFHSQAGWIAFNVIALGFSVAAARLPWLAVRRAPKLDRKIVARSAAPEYLLPFLMILGAAMISRAVSSGLEWLYPLRFFAAAAVLWSFRRKYRTLDWRFDWSALLVGVIVFLIWIGMDQIAGPRSDHGTTAGLASLPVHARIIWLAFRTLAATVTVPIAEELAFRGFLLRRMISSDFESVSFRHFSFFAFLVSSVAFGLMHGDRWFAGTIAGMLYAGVLQRRGRIGECVVAHATTNALLAGCVLLFGRWDLW
jgi:exosortase E/protease (VPEID-CTERM system)